MIMTGKRRETTGGTSVHAKGHGDRWSWGRGAAFSGAVRAGRDQIVARAIKMEGTSHAEHLALDKKSVSDDDTPVLRRHTILIGWMQLPS